MFDLQMPRVPLGQWVEDFVFFLRENLGWFFGLVTTVVESLVNVLEAALLFPPPVVFALVAGLIGWRLRSLVFGVFSVVAFLLIDALAQWTQMVATLALVVVATSFAVAVAIPLGIATARNARVSTVVKPALDFMQTLPAFVYLIPAVTFFSIGEVPGVVATFIFSMPPGVRFTELGIRQVDKEVIEAATAFGSTPNQTLTRVQLPLARPTIMGGVNQVIMLALSMVVIAGMVGAPGLGSEVVRAITRLQIGAGFEAGLAVVIVAIFLDRVTAVFGAGGRAAPPAGTA